MNVIFDQWKRYIQQTQGCHSLHFCHKYRFTLFYCRYKSMTQDHGQFFAVVSVSHFNTEVLAMWWRMGNHCFASCKDRGLLKFVTSNSTGNVYVADFGNHCIRWVHPPLPVIISCLPNNSFGLFIHLSVFCRNSVLLLFCCCCCCCSCWTVHGLLTL